MHPVRNKHHKCSARCDERNQKWEDRTSMKGQTKSNKPVTSLCFKSIANNKDCLITYLTLSFHSSNNPAHNECEINLKCNICDAKEKASNRSQNWICSIIGYIMRLVYRSHTLILIDLMLRWQWYIEYRFMRNVCHKWYIEYGINVKCMLQHTYFIL